MENIIQVQWGGYYSSKANGRYQIFRLLDLNRNAYHIQAFDRDFDHLPTFEEIKKIKPFILHLPIALNGLLEEKDLTLIGSEKLDSSALEGYETYLKAHGVDKDSFNKLQKKLIEYSSQGSLRVNLQRNGDRIEIMHAD